MKSIAAKTRIGSNAYMISIGLLLAALLISVAFGSVSISPGVLYSVFLSKIAGRAVSQALQPFATIIFALRLPRTLLIGLTGAALAGSGASYQGLFKNPLADPYLIGVASGAGLGAVISMSIDWPYSALSYFSVPICAFLGALLTVFLVYQLAKIGSTVPTTNLILAGVAISAFATAVTSFLMLNASVEVRSAIAWLFGGATMSGWKPVLGVLPYIALGLGFLVTTGHALNVLQFGDEQAQQMGLRVRRVRLLIILAASLTTAAAVSFTGIIGFVGLIIPHAVRMIWGGDYRRLLPLSILNGASLLLVADVLARVLIPPQEIPVGIITALVGVPFFLWVLRRAKQQHYW
jgi:iron complex transport system permease protein